MDWLDRLLSNKIDESFKMILKNQDLVHNGAEYTRWCGIASRLGAQREDRRMNGYS